MDLFTDGVTVGAGSHLSTGLALLLAASQVPSNIPTGFAATATFRRRNVGQRVRLLLVAGFVLPVLVGATVGYWAVRGQPQMVQLALLAFTAGMLATVVVEEMIPKAHRGTDARIATVQIVGGFSLFALLSAYVA